MEPSPKSYRQLTSVPEFAVEVSLTVTFSFVQAEGGKPSLAVGEGIIVTGLMVSPVQPLSAIALKRTFCMPEVLNFFFVFMVLAVVLSVKFHRYCVMLKPLAVKEPVKETLSDKQLMFVKLKSAFGPSCLH